MSPQLDYIETMEFRDGGRTWNNPHVTNDHDYVNMTIDHKYNLYRILIIFIYLLPIIITMIASNFIQLSHDILVPVSIWYILGSFGLFKGMMVVDQNRKNEKTRYIEQLRQTRLERERIRAMREDYDARMEVRRRVERFRNEQMQKWGNKGKKKTIPKIEFLTEQDMEL